MDRARSRQYLAALGIPVWRLRASFDPGLDLPLGLDPDLELGLAPEQGQDRPAPMAAAAAVATQRPPSAAGGSTSASPTATVGAPPRTGARASAMDAIQAALGDKGRSPAPPYRPAPVPQPTKAPGPIGAGAVASTPLAPANVPTAGQQPPDRFPAATRAQPPSQVRPTSPGPSQEPPPWLDEAPPEDEPPPWFDADADGAADWFVPDQDATPAPVANPVLTMDWDTLAATVAGCRACGLCERRTNTVFGVGNREAALMLVGEAPGQDEDRQGEPFVGRAGQVLDRMLAAIGLPREQVFIANVVKCRPPNNRVPAPDEAAACRAYLTRQIELVRPRLLVSLGGVSANALLGTVEQQVGRLRGRVHEYRPHADAAPTPLIVTYHPSYYLRSPAEKARGWQDLQRIVKYLAEN